MNWVFRSLSPLLIFVPAVSDVEFPLLPFLFNGSVIELSHPSPAFCQTFFKHIWSGWTSSSTKSFLNLFQEFFQYFLYHLFPPTPFNLRPPTELHGTAAICFLFAFLPWSGFIIISCRSCDFWELVLALKHRCITLIWKLWGEKSWETRIKQYWKLRTRHWEMWKKEGGNCQIQQYVGM